MERQQFFSEIFEKSREGILITDHHGIITMANPAFTQISGYSENEILGKNYKLLESDFQDRKFFQGMRRKVVETGQWHGEVFDNRKDGETYPINLSIYRVTNEKGEISNFISFLSDLSKIKESEDKLQNITNFDLKTGLPNRLLFQEHFLMALRMASRRKRQIALLLLDLDRFKVINDTLGHQMGDRMLKIVGERLNECVRGSDTIGYMGGDEFSICLSDIEDTKNAAQIARKIHQTFDIPFNLGGEEVITSTSIGITIFPHDGEDMDSLLKNADTALYHAKAKGKSVYEFYSAEMLEKVNLRLEIEKDLHKAVKQKEFFLVYQPKVNLQTGNVSGMEALIRWVHPEKGFIRPDHFIGVAEESKLILPIGKWVLEEASRQIKQWEKDGFANLRVAVNVTAAQFGQSSFLEDLQEMMREIGIQPKNLELELTERMIMANAEESIIQLNKIKELGISISVDDFGTGYSSLAYLKRFPLDCIKIDKSFIDDIPGDNDAEAISRSIIALAHSLRMYVVAEGVETQEQLDFLLREGCDQMQGYLFSKPLKKEEFTELLTVKKKLDL